MSVVTTRTVRGMSGIRLGALPGTIRTNTMDRSSLYAAARLRTSFRPSPGTTELVPQPAAQVSNYGPVAQPSAPINRGMTPSVFFPSGSAGSGGIFAGPGTIEQAPVPHPSEVVDITGEVVDEMRSPGTMFDPALNPVVDISPSLAPSGVNWKTWVPIGLAVAGIGAAVWILRRKK